MGNTFLTPTMVARDAAIALDNRLIVGNAVARDKENMFTAAKIGDSVTVTVPPAVSDASEFTCSTSASDATAEPVVGLIVSVPSPLVMLLTPPPPPPAAVHVCVERFHVPISASQVGPTMTHTGEGVTALSMPNGTCV